MAETLTTQQSDSIRKFLRQLKAEGVGLGKLAGPVHLELLAGETGRRGTWTRIADSGALQAALLREAEALPAVELIDLEIPLSTRKLDQAGFERLGKVHMGLASLRLSFNGESERTAAGRLLAENRSFMRALERFCEKRGLDVPLFWAGGGTAEITMMETWRLRLGPEPRVMKLFRGGLLVRPEEVTPDLLRTMAADLGGWLVRNTGADGTLPYKWWPSRGAEATGDNSLRRFMATMWLNRWAHFTGEPEARAAADRNLRRNLRVHFVEDRGMGFVDDGGKTKLGGTAFAATTIRESPLREELAETLARLDAGILFLWQPDGSFRTFHRPAERNDNQNFYPGEALTYWAVLFRETREAALHDRALKSLAWYKDWHLANRNPAFVPWHTQAAAAFFEMSGEAWLRDWCFQMNDWLLSMQQTEVTHPDLLGRFYDPKRPEYGVPHASSTGVYLEGLADAFKLAEAAGDRARREAYGRAIRLGLRSIRQLQFLAEDMAPYRHHGRLAGGVRTEVYDNGLRVDNVQHALGACLKLLAQPAFMAWLGGSAPPASP